MNDPPKRLKPLRHTQSSPMRHRVSDDILAHLAPRTAVDALSSATGALRDCLDRASEAERDFVMRTAVASRRIWEWLDELMDWPWPSGGGPAGFLPPSGKRGRLSVQLTGPEGVHEEYMGSLLVRDVEKYEERIEEISQQLEDLDVEGIKNHVLTNHILPLSRPTTPISGSNRSMLSLASYYNWMEDLTAVVTAIVIQTLPNLARLNQMLQVWSLRLVVLRGVPSLLLAIEDAEVALKSGWNAISTSFIKTTPQPNEQSDAPSEPTLKRTDFNVMRMVLENKVSKPGSSLDHMLDCLEGQRDTLPEEWLDRMEAVERDYSDWVVACERKMRETEWTKSEPRSEASQSSSLEKQTSGIEPPVAPSTGLPIVDPADDAITLPVPLSERALEDIHNEEQGNGVTSVAGTTLQASPTFHMGNSQHKPHRSFDGPQEPPRTPEYPDPGFPEDFSMLGDADSPMDDELELPPLRVITRQNSDISEASTVLHQASSFFDGSDLPEVSRSPDIPKGRIRQAEYLQASPPSSPPMYRTREPLMPFDSPLVAAIPEDDEYYVSPAPFDGSFAEDFDDSMSVTDATPSFTRRESVGDQQLRQQLTQIIDSIPARIKLSESSRVNLNPPDLQLPKMKKKPSLEPFKRSASNLSSRAATPSFTLSPAKNSRVRPQRGQSQIKVYHLSRAGEAPIKLFIRCVGEQGERVMVRVGGGWADLGEYLKEYATHHGRRSVGTDTAKVEVQDAQRPPTGKTASTGSNPPSRPGSSAGPGQMSPLAVRKARRSVGAMSSDSPRLLRPKTPAPDSPTKESDPSPGGSTRSRSSSRFDAEDDSSFLGLAGPTGKKVDMSEENKAWVESIKEKVRMVSGEMQAAPSEGRRFGELGKVGGTKRVFRKSDARR